MSNGNNSPGSWSFGQLVVTAVIVGAVLAVLFIALPAMGVIIPAWVMQIFWVLVIAFVAILAIKFLLGMR